MTIDQYLARLRRELRVGFRRRRRILRELEGHLQDAVAHALADARLGAESQAVARLGPPEELAASFSETPRRRAPLVLAAAVAACGAAAAVLLGLGLAGGRQLPPLPGTAVRIDLDRAGIAGPSIDASTVRQVVSTTSRNRWLSRVRLLAARNRNDGGIWVAAVPASAPAAPFVPLGGFPGAKGGSIASASSRLSAITMRKVWWTVVGPIQNRGFSLFEATAGPRGARPYGAVVVGIARAPVVRVVALTPNGPVELPLNRWRGFAFSPTSDRPASTVIEAYDARGRRVGRATLPAPRRNAPWAA